MSRQIVLMTGCSAGIGLATAKHFSLDPDQRYIVIATIIAMSEKNDLVTAVGDALNKTIFIEELDVTRDTDITTVVERTLKEYGRIDILLNIAGICSVSIPERMPRDMMEKMFNVNVFGAIRLTQAVLPQMKRRKTGKIIVISSIAGRTAWPYLEVYSSNKFALEGYFEALAVGLRAFNIRVCLVEPGGVKTYILRESIKSIEHLLQDGSIEENDRRQLEGLAGIIAEDKGPTKVTSETVAEAIMTRCIDLEKPALRHFLAEEFYENVQAGLADMTGEKAVASSQGMF
ncbi:retinol dehydrogenase 8-like [Lytechinus pictus]|uniref:retinol dehydrogenase 8-like n=1 Tax=Lytechinus pictus TaxID=7653 RepID=UPI00240E0287|nr:retinol dehydrogenase 8-like [Lytechinus pictus]